MAKKKAAGGDWRRDIETFMDALFRDVDGDRQVLVWTLPNKRSHWAPSAEAAAKKAAALRPKHDVYVGVGIAPADFGVPKKDLHKRRCPSHKIAGISGIVIDVDVEGPGHKKKRLPKTYKEAERIVGCLGLEPTMVVSSGGGIHAWWLFKEPWWFDDDEERARAERLSQLWTATIKRRAMEDLGVEMDSVWELARVMRVPGTMNRKSSPPTPASFLEEPSEGKRWLVSDLEDAIPPDVVGDTPAPEKSRGTGEEGAGDTFTLRAGANPPFRKFDVFINNSPKFKGTWERTRKDLNDTSSSGYDMSLAVQAAMVDWTNQEIVDLLVASHEKHGDDKHHERVDYYAITLRQARNYIKKDRSLDRLSELSNTDEVAGSEASSEPADRGELLTCLSEVLGIAIHRIVKYTSDPPSYRLETARGAIMLGGVAGLIDQRAFRTHVAAATGKSIPRYKTPAWAIIEQHLLDVCEEVEVGEEGTDFGSVRGWLADYLEETKPTKDANEAGSARAPFVDDDGVVYFFLDSLRKYVWINRMDRRSCKDLASLLRLIGCAPTRRHFQIGGSATTRSVWRFEVEK